MSDLPVECTIYLNVWVSSRRIQEALIRFKVANSWIASEGIASSSDLKMYRWDGSDWAELTTTMTSKDDTYSYYEAKTAGVSHLAITGTKQKAVSTSTPEIKPASATSTPVETTSVAGTRSESEPVSWMNILLLILLIAFVAYIYSVTRK